MVGATLVVALLAGRTGTGAGPTGERRRESPMVGATPVVALLARRADTRPAPTELRRVGLVVAAAAGDVPDLLDEPVADADVLVEPVYQVVLVAGQ